MRQIQNTKSKFAQELFVKMASTYAEQIIAFHSSNEVLHNAFGRPVQTTVKPNLAVLHGIAATGLRTSALLNAANAQAQIGNIAAMVRQHIPFTAVVAGDAMPLLPELAQTGAIIFAAADAQSVADRLLMAQVIAEKTLVPVLVLAEEDAFMGDYELPNRKELIQFLGDPDSFTNPKSAAQEMLFGKKRKRMPVWYNTDLPLSIGVAKNNRDLAFENAANEIYFQENIQALITETEAEFEKMSGRAYSAFITYGSDKATDVFICTSREADVREVLEASAIAKKERVAVILPEQLFPVPTFEEFNNKKTTGITVVESAVNASRQGWYFKEIAALPKFSNLRKSNGWYASPVGKTAWYAILENMAKGASGLQNFWVDVPFEVSNSQFPKHQVLLQQIQKTFPAIAEKSIAKGTGKSAQALNPNRPSAVMQYQDKGPAYTRLSRFYDDTACFYENDLDEYVADPFQAIPLTPAASANFIAQSDKRGRHPIFNTKNCGDIDSFIGVCPNGALPSALITIDAILKSGIQQARKRGEAIGQLVPLTKLITKFSGEACLKDGAKIETPQGFLPAAFAKALKMKKADGDKKATLEREFTAVMEGISDIPVALMEGYFNDLEKRKAGTGELFTLAVDPSSCTGCGMCVEASNGVLDFEESTPETLSKLAKTFRNFEGLPDTSGATIARLADDKNFDPFAALMLSRYFNSAYTGGSASDSFGAEKTIFRMFAALAEQTLQPALLAMEKTLSGQTAKLNATVKKLLGDSLPVTHLDSLMDVLSVHREEKMSMDNIIQEWGQAEAFKQIDKEMLQRKLSLIEAMKEWKWALQEGLSGAGKSRYSVVVDDSVKWAATYPWNNFTVPVILAQKGESAQTALGVFKGQMRHVLDQIKLLRRVDLEIINKYDPSVHDYQIAGLGWDELTEEERKLVPPVFILASQQMLNNGSMQSLNAALESGYPIKFLFLDAAAPTPENAHAELSNNNNALWPLLANANTFVGRASLANPKDLFYAMHLHILSTNGAVLSVLCPHPFAHDIDPTSWQNLSGLAVNTRGFNPFTYNPNREGSSFNMKFNTDALPTENELWQTVTLKTQVNDEEKETAYQPTWADWAFTLNDWKPQFNLQKSSANTIAVADYIKLEEDKKAKQIPVILRVSEENKIVRYAVSPEVIKATEAAAKSFAFLRELAGLHTAYPEKLEEAVSKKLSKTYEAEKATLLAEMAKEKKEWEANHNTEIKQQLKARLMQMAQEQV